MTRDRGSRRWRGPVLRVGLIAVACVVVLVRLTCGPAQDASRWDRQTAAISMQAGDLVATVDEHTTPVRPFGIDFAPSALDEADGFTQSWLDAHGGQAVLMLPAVPTRDEDDMLLAYLASVDTGPTLNEALVEAGLAFADRRVDHPYASTLIAAEREAIRTKAGVWSSLPDDPPMPEWRRVWGDQQKGRHPTSE